MIEEFGAILYGQKNERGEKTLKDERKYLKLHNSVLFRVSSLNKFVGNYVFVYLLFNVFVYLLFNVFV